MQRRALRAHLRSLPPQARADERARLLALTPQQLRDYVRELPPVQP